MKKFAAWVTDTGGWVALPIIISLVLFIYGSIIFHWNNIFSRTVHEASGWWHIAGWILTAAAIFAATKLQERGSIIGFAVLIALSWCSFMGFNF